MHLTEWIGASLIRKVGLGLSVMGVLMLLAVGAVFLQVRQQRDDASVLKVASDQQVLVQRIADRASKAMAGDDLALLQLQEAANQFDQALKELQDGGPAFGLPPAPETVRTQLEAVDLIWQPTSLNVQVIADTKAARLRADQLLTELRRRIVAVVVPTQSALEMAEDLRTLAILDEGFRGLINRLDTRAQVFNDSPDTSAEEMGQIAVSMEETLQAVLGGDPARELSPATGAFRESILDPLDGLLTRWNPIYAVVLRLQPEAEEYGEAIAAARSIAIDSEVLLQESALAVDLFEEDAQSKVRGLQWVLGVVAAVFVVVFGVVLWTTWRAIRPLDKLTEATAVLASGDLTARVEVASKDEVGVLASSFNRMAGELATANQELEAFNYSVSHDLRAPLLSIDGFSQALLEDYNDVLDTEGKDYLQRVRTASHRMDQLIDDMLDLSRATRSEMYLQDVDLSALANSIAEELRQREPGRRVTFKSMEGLTANGDEGQLRIVLNNLLGNAWKFTSGHAEANIRFGITEQDGKDVYFVSDDGTGFDMAKADELFGAFSHLEGAAAFEGSGIGLATVQRIIHRHGGEIWATAAVEEGATFYFTLA